MAVGAPAFFREKDSQLFFAGAYMEAYVPRFYFDKGLSRVIGDKIETVGIFNFRVYSDESKSDRAVLRTFSFPSIMVTCPSSVEDQTIENLVPGSDETEFKVLKYYKDDIFIDNLNVQKSSDYLHQFIEVLHSGKLPSTIPYDKILELELESARLNGVNLNVSATVLELIISEIYRSKKDLSRPFRFEAGSGKASMHDYQAINIVNIANFSSTFTAVTFQDIDFALVSSVNKVRQGKPEAVSPIEKTIKY